MLAKAESRRVPALAHEPKNIWKRTQLETVAQEPIQMSFQHLFDKIC